MTTLSPGTHAVITGGSSGLGLELARQLTRRGVDVTLVARDQRKLDDAAAELRGAATASTVRVAAADVSDPAATAAAFAGLAQDAGRIDVLINSAGILREGHFEELPVSDFREVMEVNYFGVLNATRAALPHLERSSGALVNIASVAGLTGVFGYTPYCAAKHALVGLTRSLQYELEPRGVSVVLVCPGEFDSPMVDALDRTRTPENRAHTLTIPKLGVRQIARETIAGIDRRAGFVVPGRKTRLLVTAQRLLPGVARGIGRRRIAEVYTGPRAASG